MSDTGTPDPQLDGMAALEANDPFFFRLLLSGTSSGIGETKVPRENDGIRPLLELGGGAVCLGTGSPWIGK
jgi:hypothetical protein